MSFHASSSLHILRLHTPHLFWDVYQRIFHLVTTDAVMPLPCHVVVVLNSCIPVILLVDAVAQINLALI